MRAQSYYVLAGDDAGRVYANAEAVAHYTRALALLSAGTPTTQALNELYTKRGRALELSGQYDQALANYEAMRARAREHEDRALELSALVHLVQIHSTSNAYFDAESADALAHEALQLAELLGDREAQVKILANQINLGLFSNRTAEAIQNGERALRMARELELREPLAYIVNDLARVYFADGRPERSLELLDEARRLWRELGNMPMLTDSLSSSAQALFFGGQYTQALALAGEAMELSRSIHSLWGEAYSLFHTGHIYWDRGEPDQAIAAMESCIRLADTAGFAPPKFYTRANLAMVYGSLGAVQHGIVLARQAAPLAAMHMPSLRPHVLARLASLYLMHGDVAEAEEALDSARQGFSNANALASPAVYQAEIELALTQDSPVRALAMAEEYCAHVARLHTRNDLVPPLVEQRRERPVGVRLAAVDVSETVFFRKRPRRQQRAGLEDGSRIRGKRRNGTAT